MEIIRVIASSQVAKEECIVKIMELFMKNGFMVQDAFETLDRVKEVIVGIPVAYAKLPRLTGEFLSNKSEGK